MKTKIKNKLYFKKCQFFFWLGHFGPMYFQWEKNQLFVDYFVMPKSGPTAAVLSPVNLASNSASFPLGKKGESEVLQIQG